MKTFRTALIAAVATFGAACSSVPSKPVASAPVAPAAASIAGNWILTVETPMGTMDAKMSVVQNGKVINGLLESQMGNVDYKGGVDANNVKFSYSIEAQGGPPGSFDYVGQLDAGVMRGKATFASFGEGTWSAKRQ